jgi:hypothetical protein
LAAYRGPLSRDSPVITDYFTFAVVLTILAGMAWLAVLAAR